MNTQHLPGLDPGISPAFAFCRKLDFDMCRNSAASFNESVFILEHTPAYLQHTDATVVRPMYV